MSWTIIEMNTEDIQKLQDERDKYKNYLDQIIREHMRPHEPSMYPIAIGTLIDKISKEL
jgi:hypothetical protein